MPPILMAKGGSRSPRTSASTPRSRARPSSSATPTTSRSGSPDAGGRASRESRPTSSVISGTSGSSGGRVHEPVLLAEVLAQLDPHEGGRYLDGTVGAAGHAAAVLERSGPSGKLLGIDRDPEALAAAARELSRFGDRALLVRANFALCDDVARTHGFAPVDGVLLDLGLSSLQLANEERGFSFRARGPLDRRADPDVRLTAADIVNSWSASDLRRVFAEYGEEPEAARIAAAIVRRRSKSQFETADELGRFVAGVKTRRRRNTDPATRVLDRKSTRLNSSH